MSKKNDVFVEHILKHLRKMYADDHIVREVCCKICNKTIDKIYEEYKDNLDSAKQNEFDCQDRYK